MKGLRKWIAVGENAPAFFDGDGGEPGERQSVEDGERSCRRGLARLSRERGGSALICLKAKKGKRGKGRSTSEKWIHEQGNQGSERKKDTHDIGLGAFLAPTTTRLCLCRLVDYIILLELLADTGHTSCFSNCKSRSRGRGRQ